jgi:type I restriction enzyme S subunit
MSAIAEATQIAATPSGWDVLQFSDLFEFKNGVNADKRAYGHGVPFANVLEVITNTHLHAELIPGRVALDSASIKAFDVRPGDVLFNRTSETQGEVGLSSVYLGGAPVVFGGFVIRGRPKRPIHSVYAGYALRAPAVRSQIVARGQGAIRANIGQGDLRRVVVVLPSPDVPNGPTDVRSEHLYQFPAFHE